MNPADGQILPLNWPGYRALQTNGRHLWGTEGTIFWNLETRAISIQSWWSNIKRKLIHNTLWWTGPQWLSQESSIWSTKEVKTPTDKPEITNVHVALVCGQEGITHIFQAQQTHSSPCILQKIHELLATQGQQAINHSLHTRSWEGSDMLCADSKTSYAQ